jgi:FkbM family methyltransferase
MTKTAICLVVKNEAAAIQEWIAFHAIIGFGTFLILDDGSTDETVALATQAGKRLDVRVMPWTETERGRQGQGYAKICARFRDEFDWIAFIDSDEFLLPVTGESLETMLARHEQTAGIAFPWRLFGTSGHRAKPAGLVIENFQYCAPAQFKPNQHVKSMVRPALVRGGVNPHYFEVDGSYALADGRPVEWGVAPGILNGYPPDITWQINHYFTRSLEHWTERMRRGQMGNFTRTMEEFHQYDENGVLDTRAAFYGPRVRAVMASESAATPPAEPAPAPATRQRPETCAVVLIVKNEISDIAAWLAWYHALGFDACIIFDDGSTDGTWEFLQRAAAAQDIRLLKAQGPAGERYEARQEESYRYALKNFRDEFDWLAFLDADEFLYLAQDETIQKFLARFPDADAVAVNWCNYGSSGHFLKPEAPPFEAFTWHGNEQRYINRHVKTLVRAAKVGPNWQNVHAYDVPLDRYVLPNGEKIRWTETRGIINQDPDWRIAKVMHYQCRSMEHFIERLKRHPRMASIPHIWRSYDVQEAQSSVPPHLVAAAKQQMARLQDAQTATPEPAAPVAATSGLQADLIFDIGMSEGNDTAFYLAKGFRVVGVEAAVKTYFELCDRFSTEISASRLRIENFAASDSADRLIEFFHHDVHQGLSGLSRGRAEFKEGNFTSYFVSTINWPVLVARHGVPYYLKIDIEGAEAPFLSSMAGSEILPTYISVECHALAPVEALYELGYRHFKLVDQNPPGGFSLPAIQQEGRQIDWQKFHHSSGPFGRDLPAGDWLTLEDFKKAWHAVRPEMSHTWFDCHAWLG